MLPVLERVAVFAESRKTLPLLLVKVPELIMFFETENRAGALKVAPEFMVRLVVEAWGKMVVPPPAITVLPRAEAPESVPV